jgi:crotonobetainyl-CoA:carnitine CoA-transferase CaiB-like acyl-CoA transferase
VGFDGVAQAMSGAMSLTGFPEAPLRSVVNWADFGTALHGAFGAMAALYHRANTGRGQAIDVSLLATSVTFMGSLLAERAALGLRRERRGNAGFWTAPSDAYRTRDGWLLVPTIGQWMFGRWARLVGREDLLDDPRYSDDISRGNHYQQISDVMAQWCAARTQAEALAALARARIPSGPINELGDLLADPQVQARGMLSDCDWPGSARPVPIAATAVRLSETPPSVRHRAPQLGEHTDEILGELGFTSGEIARYRASGVV